MRSRCAFGCEEIGDLASEVCQFCPSKFAPLVPRLVSTIESSGKLTATSAEGMCLVVAFTKGGRSLRWIES
jgi:hypothetical protein